MYISVSGEAQRHGQKEKLSCLFIFVEEEEEEERTGNLMWHVSTPMRWQR